MNVEAREWGWQRGRACPQRGRRQMRRGFNQSATKLPSSLLTASCHCVCRPAADEMATKGQQEWSQGVALLWSCLLGSCCWPCWQLPVQGQRGQTQLHKGRGRPCSLLQRGSWGELHTPICCHAESRTAGAHRQPALVRVGALAPPPAKRRWQHRRLPSLPPAATPSTGWSKILEAQKRLAQNQGTFVHLRGALATAFAAAAAPACAPPACRLGRWQGHQPPVLSPSRRRRRPGRDHQPLHPPRHERGLHPLCPLRRVVRGWAAGCLWGGARIAAAAAASTAQLRCEPCRRRTGDDLNACLPFVRFRSPCAGT